MTNIRERRRRRVVLSHIPTRFALFATSAILILSSLFAIQIDQSVWAGTFPGPNGQIAFVKGINGEPETYEIYIMNADDGSGQTRLTENGASDGDPSWSPDGTKIAFSSNREDDNSEIYIMNADDGSGQTRLTENGVDDFSPSWSPDGERIAFVSDRDGNRDIYIMNADDGSGQTRLTDDPAFDGFPTWSPDGTKIAFVSDRDSTEDGENNAIYIMNADDGSGQTRLTENGAFYSSPDWGTNTLPRGGGSTPPLPTQQAIDEVISTMQNLDNVPQSVKTSIIALLGEVSNIVNEDIQITIDQALARFLVP